MRMEEARGYVFQALREGGFARSGDLREQIGLCRNGKDHSGARGTASHPPRPQEAGTESTACAVKRAILDRELLWFDSAVGTEAQKQSENGGVAARNATP
jgi:hypothetical protein